MRKISLLILLFINSVIYSQEYTYTHYNVVEGLAGSTVYCAEQDKDGFIWFGTETGLSRFDGTNFLNFSIAQGLPDNEVIKIFCDSQNRVWLSLFRAEICFIYNGKVHNKHNDSTLKKIHLHGIAWQVCEDKNGDILIREYTTLHIITAKKSVLELKSLDNKNEGFFSAISQSENGNFLVCDNDKVYELNSDFKPHFVKEVKIPDKFKYLTHLSAHILLCHSSMMKYTAYSLNTTKRKLYQNPPALITTQILNDSLICTNNINGCLIQNFFTGNRLDKILPGEPVSSVFIDNEGNYWFTTLGRGIFKLNSTFIKTIALQRANGSEVSVYSLIKFNNSIVAGTDGCYLFSIDAHRPENYIRWKLRYAPEVKNRIIGIQKFGNTLYVGADDNLLKTNLYKLEQIKSYLSIKDLFLLNKDTILVGAFNCLILLDANKLKIIDTIFKERVTSLNAIGNEVYIGTINGLIIKNLLTKTEIKPNTIPHTRITDIERDDNNVIWIGTYGQGVIGYKSGKVVAAFSVKDGLTSNICRCISVYQNNVWVGTDKGLNKISFSGKSYSITNYTNTDGLPTNIINTVLQDSQTVFIGTASGITYFNHTNSVVKSKCILHINLITSGNDTLKTPNIKLAPRKNEIKFDYVGISYNSGGDIKYYYKIKELKDAWTETNNTSIIFPSLPAGKYTFQIKAVNKYGASSKTITIPFEIERTIWQKFWFRLLLFIVACLFIWSIVNLRIKTIKKRERERISIKEQIAELKQKALKSQINPHFIFNCLNSIQQYIIDNDVEGSNRFISNFAKVIRKTLDFSERNEITLLEEINYLDDYLKLEKERFEDTFSYSIYIDEKVNIEHYKLPPLILQPLIENAVRHGVRARNDNKGIININVKFENFYILITIQDNGPGINLKDFKSAKSLNHTSMGIKLVMERIKVLNDSKTRKISFEIENSDNTVIFPGTISKLRFPL